MPDTIDQTIASLHDAGATDEEITGILKEKFGKPQQPTRAEANPTDAASGIYDAPREDAPSVLGGVMDAAKGFVKSAGRSAQSLGDLPHMVGLPGLTEGTDALYGLPAGSSKKSMQATNPAQKVGGYVETAAELLPTGIGVVNAAKAAPGMVARGLGISSARAAENIASATNAAKNVALNVNGPGAAALRVTELGERGASVPRVVQTFMRRVTDPSKGPLNFEEARDFYSNISRLSADEYGRLNPVVKRAVSSMREALHASLTDAAGTVGKGEEYAAGISEYAKAARAKAKISDLTPSLPTAAKALGAGGVVAAILRALSGGQ